MLQKSKHVVAGVKAWCGQHRLSCIWIFILHLLMLPCYTRVAWKTSNKGIVDVAGILIVGVQQFSAPLAIVCAVAPLALILREAVSFYGRTHRTNGPAANRRSSWILTDLSRLLVATTNIQLPFIVCVCFVAGFPVLSFLDLKKLLLIEAMSLVATICYAINLDRLKPLEPNRFSGFPLAHAVLALGAYLLIVLASLDQVQRVTVRLADDCVMWLGDFYWVRLAAIEQTTMCYGSSIVVLTIVLLCLLDRLPKSRWRGTTLAALIGGALSFFIVGVVAAWLFFGGVSRLTMLPLIAQQAYVGTVLSLAWPLTVIPFLTVAPALIVAFNSYDDRGSKSATPRAYIRRQVLHLVRGHHVLLAIMQQHVTIYSLTLLASLGMPVGVLFGVVDRNLTTLNIWFGATAAWLAPFFSGLIFIEDTYAKAYAAGLLRVIHSTKGHLLVIGYGDLGERFVAAQFRSRSVRYIDLYDDTAASRNVLLPNGELAKVLMRVLVVDKERGRFAATTKTPDQFEIAIADVSQHVPDHATDGRVRFVVPVVVGDGTREDVQRLAGLEHAAFLCCLAGPSGETSPARLVFSRLEALQRVTETKIPALLALHAGRDVAFITNRTVLRSMPVHCIMPEHVGGQNAAHILHAAYVKAHQHNSRPRVLLCGSGKRLFYAIDSFFKELSWHEYDDLVIAECQSKPPLLLLSKDPVFGRLSSQTENDPFRRIEFSRLISRNPRVPNTHSQRARVPTKAFPLALAQVESHYGPLRELLRDYQPDVVLVCDETAEDEIRLLHSVIVNLVRLHTEAATAPGYRFPTVLVSGETGQDHLTRNLEDALVYYSGRMFAANTPSSTADAFPSARMAPSAQQQQGRIPFVGDSLIDILDDPVQRACGLVASYGTHDELPALALPIELSFCTPDHPTELAHKFARLAGYTRSVRDPNGYKKEVSIQNFRVRAGADDGKFEIRTLATLVPFEGMDDTSPLLDWCRVLATGDGAARKRAIETVRFLLWGGDAATLPVLRDGVRECCGMPTCPVEGIHKLVEATGSDAHGNKKDRLEKSIAASFDVASGPNLTGWVDATAPPFDYRPDRPPLASIRLHCKSAAVHGALAGALNALVFRKLKRFKKPAPEYVFNFFNVSGYRCHDARWGETTCYGRIERHVPVTPPNDSIFERVEIHPTLGADEWRDFAQRLATYIGLTPSEPDAGVITLTRASGMLIQTPRACSRQA